MARTIIGVNDPKAVRKQSVMLAVDVGREAYFSSRFMSAGEDGATPIQRIDRFETEQGDSATYDLNLQLKGQFVEGDEQLEGNEEELKFATDALYIDQARHGVNAGGKMTRKRTVHNLRLIARKRLKEYWTRVFDEMFFMYLSGARGANADWITRTNYPGFANNPLSAPDTMHQLYSGAATSKASLVSGDVMALSVIDKAVARASLMGGGSTGIPAIQPVNIDGAEHYVCVMSPHQEYAVRTSAATGQWLDIQKAAAASEARNNPIFKGGLGMYNDVVLHKHKGVVRFTDYGAGANVNAARSLFMGRQAAVVAFGDAGNRLSFDWNEETDDRGNQLVVTTSTIFGIKKCGFTVNGTNYDFGVLSIDSAIDATLG